MEGTMKASSPQPASNHCSLLPSVNRSDLGRSTSDLELSFNGDVEVLKMSNHGTPCNNYEASSETGSTAIDI